jgi:hypothetical protein
MTDLLLVLVLIEVSLVSYQTGRIWKKLNSGEEQRMLEDNVQRAMDRMVEEVEKAKDHVASKEGIGSMDQGFENIMTYQVSLGRGRMSEGEPWNV